MEIQYWADIACPYCYMGITQLQRALKELKIADQTPLKFMSFQLDPTLPTTTDLSMTEYYAKTHQLTKQEAVTQIHKIDQLAADIDLPIKMENAIPVNTLAAHRLIKRKVDEFILNGTSLKQGTEVNTPILYNPQFKVLQNGKELLYKQSYRGTVLFKINEKDSNYPIIIRYSVPKITKLSAIITIIMLVILLIIILK